MSAVSFIASAAGLKLAGQDPRITQDVRTVLWWLADDRRVDFLAHPESEWRPLRRIDLDRPMLAYRLAEGEKRPLDLDFARLACWRWIDAAEIAAKEREAYRAVPGLDEVES